MNLMRYLLACWRRGRRPTLAYAIALTPLWRVQHWRMLYEVKTGKRARPPVISSKGVR